MSKNTNNPVTYQVKSGEYVSFYHSSVGWFRLVATAHALRRIDHVQPPEDWRSHLSPKLAIFEETEKQLNEYFANKRTEFDLPLDPQGTAFQKQVWDVLITIPFGKTVSYKDIAVKIDKPKGSQAVGQANGKNPISVVIPCHRVIGKNGSLTGYAGGLDRKSKLLALELAETPH